VSFLRQSAPVSIAPKTSCQTASSVTICVLASLAVLACERRAALPDPDGPIVGPVTREQTFVFPFVDKYEHGLNYPLEFEPGSVERPTMIVIRQRLLERALPSTLPASAPPIRDAGIIELGPSDLRLLIPAGFRTSSVYQDEILELFFAASAQAPFTPAGVFQIDKGTFQDPPKKVEIPRPGFWAWVARERGEKGAIEGASDAGSVDDTGASP
jgi:hypothetical protein